MSDEVTGMSKSEVARIELTLRQQAQAEVRKHREEMQKIIAEINKIRMKYGMPQDAIDSLQMLIKQYDYARRMVAFASVALLPGNQRG